MFRVCFLIGAGIKKTSLIKPRERPCHCARLRWSSREVYVLVGNFIFMPKAREQQQQQGQHTTTTTARAATATAERRAEAATTATSQQQSDTHLPTWAAWCESVLLLRPSPFLSRVPPWVPLSWQSLKRSASIRYDCMLNGSR